VKGEIPVLLDACVLVPMPLADTLLRLATGPRLYLPKWSDQIMVEVSRTLQEKFGLSSQKAMHRENEIRRHFPEAWIDDYEDLIPTMTNHPKDRHVLAAAARAGVKVIVTYNLKDFPPTSLAPYSITAQGPSAFLKDLYAIAPSVVMRALETQASAIGQNMEYLLSRLRVNTPAFVAMIEETLSGKLNSADNT
jgi:predicted nucleic acid-binding protein